MITRRHFLSAGAAGALAGALSGRRQALAQQRNLGRNRLVLLGTRGGPRITDYKPSPAANLIVWNNVPYVVAVMSSYGQVWASGNENWCSGGSDLNRIVRIARDENP